MRREEGYYWVKKGDKWSVAHYYTFDGITHKWRMFDTNLRVGDNFFEEINETPIQQHNNNG